MNANWKTAGMAMLAAVFAVGCGSSSQTTRSEGPPGGPGGMGGSGAGWASACPLDIEQAKIETSETFEGIELVFRTDSEDQIAALRQSVRQLAARYDARGSEGAWGSRQYSASERPGDRGKDKSHTSDFDTSGDREDDLARETPGEVTPGARERMSPESGSRYEAAPASLPVPARTQVETVSDGARIRFIAADPAQRDELRRQVRNFAQRMEETGRCDVGTPTGSWQVDDELKETGREIDRELKETGREAEETLEEGAEETEEGMRETGREIERGTDRAIDRTREGLDEAEDEIDPDDRD
jgi:ElaB/YqjD/DUF883 family membrane-anchored ribosome-binding protein